MGRFLKGFGTAMIIVIVGLVWLGVSYKLAGSAVRHGWHKPFLATFDQKFVEQYVAVGNLIVCELWLFGGFVLAILHGIVRAISHAPATTPFATVGFGSTVGRDIGVFSTVALAETLLFGPSIVFNAGEGPIEHALAMLFSAISPMILLYLFGINLVTIWDDEIVSWLGRMSSRVRGLPPS